MCVKTIVDASAFSHLCEQTPHSAGDQLRRWIARGDGILVYSAAETEYATELDRYPKVRTLLVSYVKNLRAIDINPAFVKAARPQIPDHPTRKSDDPHILALAAASEALVLFSCDRKLQKDFANSQVLRKVGRQDRRSVPSLHGNRPEDTKGASKRKKFLAKRTCKSVC